MTPPRNEEPPPLSALRTWLFERTGLEPLVAFLAKKTVPAHRHAAWYLAGGAALFLLGLQAVTGALLALYYQPAADMAYDSVRALSTEIPFGWLVRSLHHWGANALIALLVVHMASAFFMSAYRRPRELTWCAGALAFACVLAMGFSGYLLPWDQLAYSATQVGTRIAGSAPAAGPILLKLLRGGDQVAGPTLTRFYAAHLLLVPAALAALVGFHLLLVQTLGVSVPPHLDEAAVRRVPFFPDFLLLDAAVWCVLFAGLVTLAVLAPAGLGLRADPLKPAPAGVRPEWYFLFLFETLKHIPGRVLGVEGEVLGVCAFGAAGLLALLLPFLASTPRRRRVAFWIGLAALLYAGVATLLALAPGGELPVNELVAKANRVTGERVVGLVWTWAVCGWLAYALLAKRRHRRQLRQLRLLDDGPGM